MATDPKPTSPYDQLLTALEDLDVDDAFGADSWRERADKHHLTAAQQSGAHRRACRDGYLVPYTIRLPDGRCVPAATCSTTETRKGGRNLLYARTSKAIPPREVPSD